MISCRSVLEIFRLGDLHDAATTEAERLRHIAAADSLLVQFHGAAWHTAMVLQPLAQLSFCTLMWRSASFRRGTAGVGVGASALALLFWVPSVGIGVLFLSMLATMLWLPLVARDLFRLARTGA